MYKVVIATRSLHKCSVEKLYLSKTSAPSFRHGRSEFFFSHAERKRIKFFLIQTSNGQSVVDLKIWVSRSTALSIT